MREIPHPQWPFFFSRFGYRHFGWNVVVERRVPGHEPAIDDHCFLQEFVRDFADGQEQITIVLGYPFHPFRSRSISNPRHVRLPAGSGHALVIEAADGSSITVRLRHPEGCLLAA